MPFSNRYSGLIERYRERLPVGPDARVISLGEGNTPLINLDNIPRALGKSIELHVKCEGLNPTGSFKGCRMTMAVTKAVEVGSRAIIIGHPQSWDQAWLVREESDGWFDECTDEEILATQILLAESEGVFCEPASATSVTGALRDIASGKIPEGSTVVCTLTGHGLKDPDTAIKQSTADMITVRAELEAVRRAIFDNLL